MSLPGSHSYWLEVPLTLGRSELRTNNEIVIVGSGLAGVSTAYFLLQNGFKDIHILDYKPERAASFRNCGHILYGSVESMAALTSLHGYELAKSIWEYSVELCHEVKSTCNRLKLNCDYKQDGYLVMAIDATEDEEIKQSIDLLSGIGIENRYVSKPELEKLGFKNVVGARYESGSAEAHPVKFRNGILDYCLAQGVRYTSNAQVTKIDGDGESDGESDGKDGQVDIFIDGHTKISAEACVIATNAYSPLISDYMQSRQLVDPFRGQIITSKPLRHKFKVTYPHSFDHGYEYAIVSADNRLIIGGWRNHTNGERGIYDITTNPEVELGLKEFVRRHYDIGETIDWEFSWAGIMAASKTGFPFIGPIDSPRVFTVSGFTGHGFSWAHGSAKLLADIIAGQPIPEIARLFRP